jgi:predicted metal-dependent phosphoesterase TrpH
MRVGTLAITDHDTVAAIPGARRNCPCRLTAYAGDRRRDFHPLGKPRDSYCGLNIDIDHPAMTALLEEQKARRQLRAR